MPTLLHSATLPTPVGELALAVDSTGALVAVAFTDRQSLAALAGPDAVLLPDPPSTASAVAELTEYFAGSRRTFSLAVAPRIGTPFQRRVWATLPCIQSGTTWSYARLAAETGSAARAVGAANAANPLAIVLPCHRVIGARGDLTGYAGGLERKRWLLAHEGALLA